MRDSYPEVIVYLSLERRGLDAGADRAQAHCCAGRCWCWCHRCHSPPYCLLTCDCWLLAQNFLLDGTRFLVGVKGEAGHLGSNVSDVAQGEAGTSCLCCCHGCLARDCGVYVVVHHLGACVAVCLFSLKDIY